ncbi:MAG: DEAD/DEAH box helicase, partial [Eubacteriales bacterium]
STCYDLPIRITFFDDEVESIRHFNEDTQKSEGKTSEKIVVYPASDFILDEDMANKALGYLSEYEKENTALGTAAQDMCFQLREFGTFENADSFIGLLTNGESLQDYLKGALFVYNDYDQITEQARKNCAAFEEQFADMQNNGEVFPVQREFLIDLQIDFQSALEIAPVASGKWKSFEIDFKMRQANQFAGKFELLATSLKSRQKSGYHVVLSVGAKADSLSRALQEFGILAPVSAGGQGITVSREWLDYGFEIPQAKIYFLGEWDIYGKIKKILPKQKPSKKTTEELFTELAAGDYVVHEVHGRGRYLGLKKMEAAGNYSEYMEIEYRDGDRLFVPTAQIDRVQKYIGSEDGMPVLSKLGGREWENTKNKVKESIKKLAFDLVALYANRFATKGYRFSPDTVWQKQFEDNFEFEETEGQEQSLLEIKHDMESEGVMDRLLLGDVGYGKTEVAMRACFKAVMDSRQVAVLVPTTLLARQHLATFKKRFEGFPVTIDMISRFSVSRHKEIMRDVERGHTDIIIGTHKLLSRDIKFQNLGLLIVDEEQRFGVAHKEKIKLLKESVDVLTLSATPIPRTLEMSLIGIRDLSTIKTPPVSRKQTQSYVMRYSDSLVRDAVRSELKRGGQVYFVCRQINQMDRLIGDIRKNVPEARVASVHGQMAENHIESTVSA